MGTLYTVLASRAPASAMRVVDTCVKELPEYQAVAVNPDDYARMLEFAVFIRRRTLELAPDDCPLTGDDLATIATIGAERGGQGMSLTDARGILALHAAATLREIHEACGPADFDEGMHLLGWLGRQATIAQQAYTVGVLQGQKRHRPVISEIGQFVGLALDSDPAAPAYARNWESRLSTTAGSSSSGHPVPVRRTRPPLSWCGAGTGHRPSGTGPASWSCSCPRTRKPPRWR